MMAAHTVSAAKMSQVQIQIEIHILVTQVAHIVAAAMQVRRKKQRHARGGGAAARIGARDGTRSVVAGPGKGRPWVAYIGTVSRCSHVPAHCIS